MNNPNSFLSLFKGCGGTSAFTNLHVGHEISDLASCRGKLLPAHWPGSKIPLWPLTSNFFGRARDSSAEQPSNFLIKENKSKLPAKRM